MNLLPPNPTPFDYFHAIRALSSREGSKAIFDLADAAMNLPEPKHACAFHRAMDGSCFVCGSVDESIKADLAKPSETPETDAEAIRHCANWSNCGDHVREIVFADFARSLERQRNEWFSAFKHQTKKLGEARQAPATLNPKP